MTTFLNILNKTKKIIFFWITTYLFINLYYFLFLENLLKIQNFTNLNVFLLWLLLGLFYLNYIIIIYFYYLIISFFFINFINNQFNINYTDLHIIKIENNVYITLSSEIFKKIPEHPFSNYYFDPQDLSLNLKCELKWINYGWNLFKIIKQTLNNKQFIENYLSFNNIFILNNTLQSLHSLEKIENKNHTIYLFIKQNDTISELSIKPFYIIEYDYDISNIIKNLNEFNYNWYFKNNNNNNDYTHFYHENDLIHFKLKLNLLEYLIFCSKKIQPIFEFKDF